MAVSIEVPAYPGEAEVCSYFPQEEWVVMTEFEKNSYRNAFHNYSMMKILGFDPEKPQFMIHSSQKSSLKRKEGKSKGPAPAKRIRQETSETKTLMNEKSKYEEAETIPTALKNKSIQIHNVFCDVLRVYLRSNGKCYENRLSSDIEVLKTQMTSDSDIDKNAETDKKIQVGDEKITCSRNKHLEDEMCKKTVGEKQEQRIMEAAENSQQIVSERRYPRRNVTTRNYTESKPCEDDEYVFCDLCGHETEGDCTVHGPLTIFHDKYAPVTGEEGRAEKTSPTQVHVAKSKIPGAGKGVWTTVGLPRHARLGPYEGKKSDQPDPLGYSWIIKKNKKIDHYIRADSTVTSNWMRFVNCARNEKEQNLRAFQFKGQMYYQTIKPVPSKTELFVWYGKEYAEKMGISVKSFRSRNTNQLKDLVFPCEKCDTTYTSPLYLKNHRKVCKANRGSKVQVEPNSLPSDVRSLCSVIESKKLFNCPVCQFKTALLHSMRYHLLVHTGQKPHTCDECGKGFTVSSNLIRHKRVHSEIKQFKCTVCTFNTKWHSRFQTHVRQHSGEKVFACSLCDYKSYESGSLVRHSRTHTGEKPYSCSHCQYRTTRANLLKSHIRSVHTKLKPHTCPHCSYSNAKKSGLNRHIKRKHSQ